MSKPKLIALDWGSTSARAYLMADENDVIGQRTAPLGILNVKNADFEGALLELCGPWLMARTDTPMIAAGMIGSRQGWKEAPYVACPVDLAALSANLAQIDVLKRRPLWIVPGVSTVDDDGVPDVMRGEETQIFGALHLAERAAGSGLYVLPGTHSKWVHVKDGRIVWIRTFMTGELFSILVQHSILGKLIEPGGAADERAFERGVNHAHKDPIGLSSLLFSVRTLPLFNRLPPAGVADYLSGLLIGHEVYTAARAVEAMGLKQEAVTLVGEMALARNYQRALTLLGWSSTAAPAFPAASGMWRIADKAGVLGLRLENRSTA